MSDIKKVIVGLDIGTTKVCAIVGAKNEHGKVEILGMGKADSLGVIRGEVRNIDKTVKSIREAVEKAKQSMAQGKIRIEINSVHVGIAGQHIKSLQHRNSIARPQNEEEITKNDVDRLISDTYNLALPPGDKIIHVIPQEYSVDDFTDVTDPVGIAGVRLSGNFHIITGHIDAIKNIYKSVNRAGLEVADLILEPLSSSDAVLTPEEMEAGVCLVDVGGGTTDVAIFKNGMIRHTAVIPFGGNIITDDIVDGCQVLRNQAELLKLKFGSALADENKENEIVCIPGFHGRPPKEVSIKNLAMVIQARVEEIFESVLYEIKSSGLERKLNAGIVITGGGSQLKHLDKLVEFVTGIDTRIGYPNEHISKTIVEEIKSPMYATGVGLVIKGLNGEEEVTVETTQEEETSQVATNKKGGFLSTWLEKGKAWLNEDDIKDF
ncbi:cell division protein FtsA [Bacteroidetes bacterium UKL13-3]|jgi:cell division protein FtsA|nr:cell division protein FtsA [Bacteroidetes bacterium UKL13-3]HCP92908.1 cell division protein FtsA [Bacteroidota bacterium]